MSNILNTVNKLLTPYNHTNGDVPRIKYIVIHYVGALGGAKANCQWYAGGNRSASAHYYVDFDGSIWQSVEDKNIAWHCGAKKYVHPECRNANSIGIELCVRNHGSLADTSRDWYFEDKTVMAAIELTKVLMEKYHIAPDHVIRHYDVTGKICPNPFVYNSGKYTWEYFKKAISSPTVKKSGWVKEDTGWKFYIYRPKAVSENAIHKLLLKNIPLIIISVLLLSLLGYVFSIRMVSQLELLTENMNQINMGLRKVTVQSKSKDEVGVLIRSFQRMMDQMNHLISEVYESKIQLQNSEMRALQAQINPHFLYNSLSIINWKAIEAGEDEISHVTLALSTYYRTSLNRGETMTTVAKEIDNIRAYLKIQLVMHDNEFRVVEQISDGLNDYLIPKLILQPLAENAIDHGIDVSDNEDPTLWLTIREENEHIFFEIRDNGAGMTQEKADQILTYQSSGYGVRNVCDRIHVLYGEKGEMKIESTPGKGTRVFIRIPKKTEAKVL